MKILLVNTVDERDSTDIPHLGLGYLASYLRKYGGYNEIRIIEKDIESSLKQFKPDIVGVSSVSQNYDIAKLLAKKAKTSGAITILGGVHVTLMPLTMTKDFDIGVLGEGEITFLELLNTIKMFGLNIDALKKINGIIYWKGNKLNFTKPRDLVTNIDSIPFPARDIIEYHWKMSTMFSSRGCPYDCVFCSSTRFWKRVRFNSPEYVVSEIKHLIEKYNTKHITFNDDLFIADRKRLEKIVSMITTEKINEDVTFTLSCRANLVNENIAKLLKKMNTELVTMGLESGSPKILRYAKGGNITIKDNTNAINILKEHDINVQATFIIGFPIDTHETIMETFHFIQNSKLDSFEVYMLAPLPATPIWDYAKKKGLVSDNMEWSKISHRASYNINEKIVLTENLSKEDLFELYNKFIFERKKRKTIHALKNAIHHPYRVPLYLNKKIFS